MSTPNDYPQLGRYQVINRIATGGMAEVFLARAVGAMGFQRLVALKLIHGNFTRDEEFVKMFIDEARIAMHLNHRNIVQVFDLDNVDGTYFIAMEFVHGVNVYDLYERIASHDRWVDTPLALYLTAEICKGLHFAHTRTDSDGQPLNIIHRDISPQNVLLSFEGEVKITDFGIATAAQRLHQTAVGIVKGKYAYMAPERLEEHTVDARVDVFGAGVLLYEMLVGENPFAGASAVETIENVLRREVPPPSSRGASVTPDLDDICLKALAKDPADRFEDAQAFADVLTEYAMDRTLARKDMAAGDAAVAQLLTELFPQRARRQPGPAEPGSILVPGIDDDLENAFDDTHAPEDQTRADVVHGDDDDDFDAPTVLRLEATDAGLDTETNPRTRRRRAPTSIQNHDTGTNTAPTQLPEDPFEPLQTVPSDVRTGRDDWPSDEAEDNAFAPTLRNQAIDETLPETDGRGVDSRKGGGASGRSTNRARPGKGERAGTSRGSGRPFQPSRTPSPTSISNGGRAEPLVVPVSSKRKGQSSAYQRRLNIAAGALLLLALVAAAAAGVASRRGDPLATGAPLQTSPRAATPATDAVTPPKKGQVIVMPTPTKAEVFIDGQRHGTGTVRAADLPLGRPIEVRVVLQGYATFAQAIELTADNPHQTLAVPLAREPKTRTRKTKAATRKVTITAPYGTWATVYYKGRALGATPTEARLPIGKIRLRVRNDEHNLDKEVRVEVARSGSSEILLPLSF